MFPQHRQAENVVRCRRARIHSDGPAKFTGMGCRLHVSLCDKRGRRAREVEPEALPGAHMCQILSVFFSGVSASFSLEPKRLGPVASAGSNSG